jgi:prephenate dehydrogenase
MGGSLALDLAESGLRVIGFDTDPGTLAAAAASGVIRKVLPPGLEGIEMADLLVLAVPVLQAPALLARAGPRLRKVVLVTDLGSTKLSIVRAAERHGLGPRFVGSHPLTGDDRSGWGAARKGLYRGSRVFLCPSEEASESSLRVSRELWASVGAATEATTPEAHDEAVAWSSHLPQFVATALGLTLGRAGISRTALGPGGRDTTRLAGSSPDMWADIALDNRAALLAALEGLNAEVEALRSVVLQEDREQLRRLLRSSRDWAIET